jgi:D-arabinose 1-dehydrogenase
VLRETGEPLDAVQSYANYTIQNTRLEELALERLIKAGVDVVPNASILGMGLLRRTGIPVGAQGDWHPAPEGLRQAVRKASEYCDELGDRIEKLAIRWALENWLRVGKGAGSRPGGEELRLGISVIGVSTLEELDETMAVWESILEALGSAGEDGDDSEVWSLKRRAEVNERAAAMQKMMGEWFNHAWASPEERFVNQRVKRLADGTATTL